MRLTNCILYVSRDRHPRHLNLAYHQNGKMTSSTQLLTFYKTQSHWRHIHDQRHIKTNIFSPLFKGFVSHGVIILFNFNPFLYLPFLSLRCSFRLILLIPSPYQSSSCYFTPRQPFHSFHSYSAQFLSFLFLSTSPCWLLPSTTHTRAPPQPQALALLECTYLNGGLH